MYVFWMSGKLYNSEFTLKKQTLELFFSLELYQTSETLLVVCTKIWKYWREFSNPFTYWKKNLLCELLHTFIHLGHFQVLSVESSYSRIPYLACAFAPPSGHNLLSVTKLSCSVLYVWTSGNQFLNLLLLHLYSV